MKPSPSAVLSLCSLLSGISQTVHALSGTAASISTTLPTPTCLPRYLGAKSSEKKASPPWGNRTCESDPENVPDTGVVRKYEWTIQRAVLAPDGFGTLHQPLASPSDDPYFDRARQIAFLAYFWPVTDHRHCLQNKHFSLSMASSLGLSLRPIGGILSRSPSTTTSQVRRKAQRCIGMGEYRITHIHTAAGGFVLTLLQAYTSKGLGSWTESVASRNAPLYPVGVLPIAGKPARMARHGTMVIMRCSMAEGCGVQWSSTALLTSNTITTWGLSHCPTIITILTRRLPRTPYQPVTIQMSTPPSRTIS
ncbi:laccase-2 [Colletotrichum fioriniae PJ7]|uniref:Laccase-2 n=1 Tax=Colletotrichum fioriniae PJ7 TaxID=1445577 RepID=A0A010RU59_9PEZI|nr:laccase-2 [Colletotrichum fioriniae PJ7]